MLGQTRHLWERMLFSLTLFWLGVASQKGDPEEILLRKSVRFREEASSAQVNEQAKEKAEELFKNAGEVGKNFVESYIERWKKDKRLDIDWAAEEAKKIVAPISSPEEIGEMGRLIALAEGLRWQVFVEAKQQEAKRLGVNFIIIE